MASDASVDVEVILKHGRTFTFKVDQAFANRGVTKEFLLKACRQSACEVSADDIEDATVNVGNTEKQSGPADSGDPEPLAYFTPKYNVFAFQWTTIAVKNLIATCKELQSKFLNPEIMKREAWGMVAAVMKRKGFSLTGGQCDEKMRNLRYRHKVLNDKRQKGGRLVIRWQHMEDMDDLMAEGPAEEPPSLGEHSAGLTAAEESAEGQEGQVVQSSSTVTKTATTPIVRRTTGNTSRDRRMEERRSPPMEQISNDSTYFANTESASDQSFESLTGNTVTFQGPYWSKAATKCLIASYKAMQDKFKCPDVRKREAWDMLSVTVRAKGYRFSGFQCGEKMRALNCRYKQICEKRQNAKKGEVIRWRYLSDMDSLMGGMPTAEPVTLVKISNPRTSCDVADDDDNDDKSAGEELCEHRQESQDKTAEKIKLAITKVKAVVRQVTPNKSGDSPQKDQSTESVYSANPEHVVDHETDSGNPPATSGGQWSSEAVRCLIETYRTLQKKFHCHDLKKREAWDMVAEVMETKGHQVTGSQVQDKMRNLKFRHKVLLDRMRKTGDRGRTKWKYMQDMDELMAAERPVVEPVALIQVNHSDISSDVGDDHSDDGDESAGERVWGHRQGLEERTMEKSQSVETRTLRRCSRLQAKSRENPISFAEADSDVDEDPESPQGISMSGGLRSSVAVKLLIETYKWLRGKFNCTNVRKRQAWKMVAAAMRRKGFQVTGLQCDSKMRYLRFRHRLRDKKRQKFGSKRLRYWVHMDDMDKLVAEEQGVEPQAPSKGSVIEPSSDVADGDDDDDGDGNESAGEECWGQKRDLKEEREENKEAESAKKNLAPVIRRHSRRSPGEGSSLEEMSEDSAPADQPESGPGEKDECATRIQMSGGHWSSRAVKCLIATYRALHSKFHSPYITKIRAWQMVAASMKRKGYPVTGSLCNAKMRSLRFRYKLIKDKGKKGQRFWEHLGDMHDLMERKGGALSPIAVVRVHNNREVVNNDTINDQSAGDSIGEQGQEMQEGAPKRTASVVRQVTQTRGGKSSKNPARLLKVESVADENQDLSPFAGAQWSSSAVKYLIAAYKALQSEFQNPDIMKKDAWEMVAALMKKKGFRVTGSQCDDKMRNLKFRHKMVTLRRQKKKMGEGYKNRWEHLEDMDNLMSGGPPAEPLVSLKVDNDPLDNQGHVGGSGEVSEEDSAGEDSWNHSLEPVQDDKAGTSSSVVAKTATTTRVIPQLTMTPSGGSRSEDKSSNVADSTEAKGFCFPPEPAPTHNSSKEAVRQLVIDGDIYRRWHRLRTSQDIGNDSEMAAFLLQYYEKYHRQKEFGMCCVSCQRALPPVCSACGPSQHHGNARAAQGEARGQQPQQSASSADAKKEGRRSRGKEPRSSDPPSWEAASSSSFQGPGGGDFKDVGKATSARNLPSSSEEEKLFTNLYPVAQDQIQANQFSLLSSSQHQALTGPETKSASDPPLLTVTDIKMSGEAYPVKLFQVDDPSQVAVGAMFTNCVREPRVMPPPQPPALPQESRTTAESDPELGGYEMEDDNEEEEEEEEEDCGRMEEDRAVAGTSGEIEQDVKASLDVSLAELSQVLMTRRLPRCRAPRKTWGPPPYLCQECGLSFDKSSNLVRHIYKHTGEYPYPCPECDSAFVTRTELAHHFRRHTGEKPFLCPICGTAYSRSCNLETHMRTHTGERPYKCGYCPAQFTTSSARSRHQRMHTGEKPYVCSQCNTAFQQLNMLKVHQYHHTGIRSFQCQRCGMAFYRKSSLRRHMRRVQCTKR